jgi:hypothetical protein
MSVERMQVLLRRTRRRKKQNLLVKGRDGRACNKQAVQDRSRNSMDKLAAGQAKFDCFELAKSPLRRSSFGTSNESRSLKTGGASELCLIHNDKSEN